MFTGIIEEIGTITSPAPGGGSLELRAMLIRDDCKPGDSVAVNGVCLTVTAIHSGGVISFDVSPETMSRSNIGALVTGSPVNLERAMPADGRFGGHLVSGHIDAIGTVGERRRDGNAVIFTITAPPVVTRLLVEKGSIAVDGISLTVARCDPRGFSVAVIPHTLDLTILKHRVPGDRVNLENDMVAKYLHRFTLEQPGERSDTTSSAVDIDLLRRHGFA
ncbi:MAG: riboflavin synthase [Deltaproteobacteria bacterium]|nr:riboflavin synthase [Candidatus Anaeroferrophillacea bacterium]